MKTRFSPIFTILIIAALSISSSEMLAQETTVTTADFTINLEINNDAVTLRCTEGCDWKNITLNDKNTTIDSIGIISKKDAGRASLFIVTIEKNDKGITLRNIKGALWKNPIEINCDSCKLVVNQFGLLQ